jgi:hypothetical protein
MALHAVIRRCRIAKPPSGRNEGRGGVKEAARPVSPLLVSRACGARIRRGTFLNTKLSGFAHHEREVFVCRLGFRRHHLVIGTSGQKRSYTIALFR